jgi:hypothetical protein
LRPAGADVFSRGPADPVKAQLREDRAPATAANQVWAMDFVHDPLFDGCKIRILTLLDTFNWLSHGIGKEPAPGLNRVDSLSTNWRCINRLVASSTKTSNARCGPRSSNHECSQPSACTS